MPFPCHYPVVDTVRHSVPFTGKLEYGRSFYSIQETGRIRTQQYILHTRFRKAVIQHVTSMPRSA